MLVKRNRDSLETEIALFAKVLDIEKKKRHAILTADGNGLQKLVEESEKYVQQLKQISKTLSVNENKGIQVHSKDYYKIIQNLKEIIDANQKILENTKQTIQSILSELQGKEQELSTQKHYKPNTTRSTLIPIAARILNKGA